MAINSGGMDETPNYFNERRNLHHWYYVNPVLLAVFLSYPHLGYLRCSKCILFIAVVEQLALINFGVRKNVSF